MHPGFMAWWKHAHAERRCGAPVSGGDRFQAASCRPGRGEGESEARFGASDAEGDPGVFTFGVRRPLRFLAFKLELSDAQVAEMATVLNELKTERAQATVDHRRTISALADALVAEPFDEPRVSEAAAERVRTAERLSAAVSRALQRIHALLNDEQRKRLAYLLRTGTLTI